MLCPTCARSATDISSLCQIEFECSLYALGASIKHAIAELSRTAPHVMARIGPRFLECPASSLTQLAAQLL